MSLNLLANPIIKFIASLSVFKSFSKVSVSEMFISMRGEVAVDIKSFSNFSVFSIFSSNFFFRPFNPPIEPSHVSRSFLMLRLSFMMNSFSCFFPSVFGGSFTSFSNFSNVEFAVERLPSRNLEGLGDSGSSSTTCLRNWEALLSPTTVSIWPMADFRSIFTMSTFFFFKSRSFFAWFRRSTTNFQGPSWSSLILNFCAMETNLLKHAHFKSVHFVSLLKISIAYISVSALLFSMLS